MLKFALISWLGLVLLAAPVLAKPAALLTPPPVKATLSEVQLHLADQALLSSYAERFPRDNRYNDVLNRISIRLLQNSQEPLMPEVHLAVYYSDLGFNAVALYRIVVLDSLLLDGLKRYAQGAVVYGTVVNGYTDKLAVFIGALHVSGQLGIVSKDFDKRNPYRIPPPPGLDEPMEKEAEALFEDMLAAWLCHEVSHIFSGHVQERYAAGRDLQQKLLMDKIPPEQAQELVTNYLDYSLGPAKEFEADARSAQILKNAGYSRESQRRVLYFCKRIEEITGQADNPLRTHPSPTLRWRRLAP